MIYKSRIIKDEDWRNRKTEHMHMQFCSVLTANLSGMLIEKDGYFVGNGWYGCNFFGMESKKVYICRDEYENCNMGGLKLSGAEGQELKARMCSFTDIEFRNVCIYSASFQKCSFRNIRLEGAELFGTVFSDCVFCGPGLEKLPMSECVFRNCTFREYEGGIFPGAVFENCCFLC